MNSSNPNAGDNPQGIMASTQQLLPEGAKDPVKAMIAILKDENIDDEDKRYLIECCQNRFRHRRRMAYVCLSAIIASTLFLFAAAVLGDGKLLNQLATHKELFIWINFFLTSIVGAYYGVSAWRPSS